MTTEARAIDIEFVDPQQSYGCIECEQPAVVLVDGCSYCHGHALADIARTLLEVPVPPRGWRRRHEVDAALAEFAEFEEADRA